jgi:hypothetical protein
LPTLGQELHLAFINAAERSYPRAGNVPMSHLRG